MPSIPVPLAKKVRRLTKECILLAAGVGAATIGLKGFLLPNNYLDGGVTGTSLVLQRVTGINISTLLFLLNLPFILIGVRQISMEFAIKSAVSIFALVLALHSIHLDSITNDPLLISIFGGFFLGSGIGLSIRGGGVIDGTEVMAVAISRRSTLSVGDVVTIFNVILFASSAALFSVEVAMYSMLTYISASKTADFLISGIEEYISITIVSSHAEDIKLHFVNELGRAVTVYKGGGGFGKKGMANSEGLILVSVVTRLEVQRVLNEIRKIDPDAFVTQHTVNDTRGGMIKGRPLH